MRERIRTLHYSLRTEQRDVNWVKRFILHHGKRHPRDLRGDEIRAFLVHLVVGRHDSASTQSQALAVLQLLLQQAAGLEMQALGTAPAASVHR